MSPKNHYDTLGVARDASAADIKKAYHRLVRQYHPDISKDPDADKKTSEINQAYNTLKDPAKRAEYDALLANPFAGQAGDAGFGGFDPRQAGSYREYHFDDSRFGDGQPFGSGDFRFDDIFSAFEGQQIRLRGQGLPGFNGGENGDLYLKIRFHENPAHYIKDRKDVYQPIRIMPWTAALGGNLEVMTPAGKLHVTIPANSKSGQNLRLKGKGIPAKEPGDLYLTIHIDLPQANSDADRAAWEQLAAHYGARG